LEGGAFSGVRFEVGGGRQEPSADGGLRLEALGKDEEGSRTREEGKGRGQKSEVRGQTEKTRDRRTEVGSFSGGRFSK
jgi:hypothetical protein